MASRLNWTMRQQRVGGGEQERKAKEREIEQKKVGQREQD